MITSFAGKFHTSASYWYPIDILKWGYSRLCNCGSSCGGSLTIHSCCRGRQYEWQSPGFFYTRRVCLAFSLSLLAILIISKAPKSAGYWERLEYQKWAMSRTRKSAIQSQQRKVRTGISSPTMTNRFRLTDSRFLGGSSGANGFLCIRGSRDDYNAWEMDGWSGDELFEYMSKVNCPFCSDNGFH